MNKIKKMIESFIDKGELEEAKKSINEYEKVVKDDVDIYSMKAVIAIMEKEQAYALDILLSAMEIDGNNFDILYNLAYVNEILCNYNEAIRYYKEAEKNIQDENLKQQIKEAMDNIKLQHKDKIKDNREKLVFFVKEGMDAFLKDIIQELSEEYLVRKIVVNNYSQIDKGMQWASICWFEWCDELIAYGSKLDLAIEKKVICRLHSYEAFTDQPSKVNWDKVNKLIFVSEHIRDFVIDKFKIDIEKTEVIPNGIDLSKYTFKERNYGFNIAYVGYINYKKGPMLLLQTFKAIYDKNSKYKLFIAGEFQDNRDVLYFQQMIKEFGIEKNVFYQGWQNDLNTWLEDKNYILCTSILESQNISVMQAMSKGIKPIIHNFVGAKNIYKNENVWNAIDEAVEMITSRKYNSIQYRQFIEENYSLDKQIKMIKESVNTITKNNKPEFDHAKYWNDRLIKMFDVVGVGYTGVAKNYNKYVYENRIYMLDNIIKSVFKNLKNISMLELGPGTGVFTEYYKNKGIKNYTAIDISEKSVSELKRTFKNYTFINGDISNEEYYNNKKYDFIYAADVLAHITNESKYESTIKNIANALNKNGICILIDSVSAINTKSESEHVVIRDENYVSKILNKNKLRLVEILPIAFFMNYPFDREVLGDNKELVLKLFNEISSMFSRDDISEQNKELMCKYLLNSERQLLLENKFGLSEKIIIITKENSSVNFKKITIDDLWDEYKLLDEESTILTELRANNMLDNKYYLITNKILKQLHTQNLTLDYIRNSFNKLLPYDKNYYNEYDFTTSQIMLGRREKINDNFEIIEFVIKNDYDKILLIGNIWYNIKNNNFIIPDEILQSNKSNYIYKFLNEIIHYKLEYSNNIAGFIFDENIKKDVEINYLTYNWERAIPCSQFMPAFGYLRIAERYLFASSFIKSHYKVLEAPCGFGYGAAYFSKLCFKVETLDLANTNIEFGKKTYNYSNINWTNGDVTILPYKDSEFDIYVSYEVFEHLPLELVGKYLSEAKRVIKSNGKLIISTPNRDMRKHINNPFHIKEYTFNEFNDLLNEYFGKIQYYSVTNFKVEREMKETALNIIAVCEK
ncbi:methyltransferase domain-containing protein [Clostridium lundense]|uniref:methyltransferase domain-containing protein n=1 Tax=Clostridium lundense TaxID=319475 RepID=UPI001FA7600A|nr:methyltransferase domain-containing protein [Clostridium lundense]